MANLLLQNIQKGMAIMPTGYASDQPLPSADQPEDGDLLAEEFHAAGIWLPGEKPAAPVATLVATDSHTALEQARREIWPVLHRMLANVLPHAIMIDSAYDMAERCHRLIVRQSTAHPLGFKIAAPVRYSLMDLRQWAMSIVAKIQGIALTAPLRMPNEVERPPFWHELTA